MALHLRPLIAEMLGTAALTLFGGLSLAMTNLPGYGAGPILPAFGHGLTLLVMVYAIGPVSGCHINPAVTIAMAATRKMDGRTAGLYIVFQLIGAVVAGLFLWAALAGAASPDNGYMNHFGSTRPNAELGMGGPQTAFVELFLTALLVFVIFNVAVLGRAPAQFHGMAIGLTLTAAILAGGPLTNASLNPARSFGPALVSAVAGLPDPFPVHWAYWAGPIVGGLLAALVVTRVLADKRGEQAP